MTIHRRLILSSRFLNLFLLPPTVFRNEITGQLISAPEYWRRTLIEEQDVANSEMKILNKVKINPISSKISQYISPYSKSSLTLTEWKFNLSFSRVSLLFFNSWRASVVPYYVTTHPPAIQKQHWHSREAQIEPPLIECKCEWLFRIRALVSKHVGSSYPTLMGPRLNTICWVQGRSDRGVGECDTPPPRIIVNNKFQVNVR